eukprot:TRINITY_DN1427_c0_g2_i2.p1 TRINITY_DN1427_c0_g2~~TRINITY_DN1427_c0_g2_i2.p1  ORF type:complete len:1453 (-),score=353.29 TRINITY_DN1427_c0_g2_i2:22-4380(-)
MDAIRVAIRIRPLQSRELTSGIGWSHDQHSISQLNPYTGLAIPSSTYHFDDILGMESTNDQVFSTVAKQIVSSSMEGINGTIFAYGQTSSGKTFTMKGSSSSSSSLESNSTPGIISLSMKEIFSIIEQSPNRQFLLRVSYIEIYNEIIKDLLSNDPSKKLKIHEDVEKGIFVGDLTEEIVKSAEQVLSFMEKGESRRHIGSTQMNEYSSRSHTIFRVIIESSERTVESDQSKNNNGKNGNNGNRRSVHNGAVKVSSLNLVDLAGSERHSSTGAEGLRLREGAHINKSLLTLSTVIKKLSESNSSHIPYRDSKLTRILQTALGGNSRTSIICNITPATIHCEETHSTLKFASRAKTIKNDPRINEVVDSNTMLTRLKNELEELKKKMSDQTSFEEVQLLQSQNQKITQDNDEMQRLLEEQQSFRRSQEEQIQRLKEMVLVSSSIQSDTISKKAKFNRRETWCPGEKVSEFPSHPRCPDPKMLGNIDESESANSRLLEFKTPSIISQRKGIEQTDQSQKEIHEDTEEIKSNHRRDLAKLEEIIDSLTKENQFLKRDQLNEVLKTENDQLKEDLREMMTKDEEQTNLLYTSEVSILKLREENEEMAEQIKKLRGKNQRLKAEKSTMMEEECESNEKEIRTWETKYAQLESNFSQISQQIEQSNKHCEDLEKKIEELTKERERWKKMSEDSLFSNNSSNATLASSIPRLSVSSGRGRVSMAPREFDHSLNRLPQMVERLESEKHKLMMEVSDLKEELSKTSVSSSKLKKDVKHADKHNSAIEKDRDLLEKELEKSKSIITDLKDKSKQYVQEKTSMLSEKAQLERELKIFREQSIKVQKEMERNKAVDTKAKELQNALSLKEKQIESLSKQFEKTKNHLSISELEIVQKSEDIQKMEIICQSLKLEAIQLEELHERRIILIVEEKKKLEEEIANLIEKLELEKQCTIQNEERHRNQIMEMSSTLQELKEINEQSRDILLVKDNQLCKLEETSNQLKRRHADLEEESELNQLHLSELTAKFNLLQEQLLVHIRTISEKENHIEEITESLNSQLRMGDERQQQLNSVLSNLKQMQEDKDNQRLQYDSALEEYKNQYEGTQFLLVEANGQIEHFRNSSEENKSIIVSLESQLASKSLLISTYIDEIDRFKVELNSSHQLVSQLERTNGTLLHQIDDQNTICESHRNKMEEERKELDQLNALLQQITLSEKIAKDTIDGLEANILDLDDQRTQLKSTIRDLEEKCKEIQRELSTTLDSTTNLTEELKKTKTNHLSTQEELRFSVEENLKLKLSLEESKGRLLFKEEEMNLKIEQLKILSEEIVDNQTQSKLNQQLLQNLQQEFDNLLHQNERQRDEISTFKDQKKQTKLSFTNKIQQLNGEISKSQDRIILLENKIEQYENDLLNNKQLLNRSLHEAKELSTKLQKKEKESNLWMKQSKKLEDELLKCSLIENKENKILN